MEYDWLFEEEPNTFSVSPEPIWTTADGEKIPLSKMTSRHICNCIKLLESKNMYKHKWYSIFKEELKRRKASNLEASYTL